LADYRRGHFLFIGLARCFEEDDRVVGMGARRCDCSHDRRRLRARDRVGDDPCTSRRHASDRWWWRRNPSLSQTITSATTVHAVNVIRVDGYEVDLDEVYRRMCAQRRRTTNGRLIHDKGLKYLLGEMVGLAADRGVPEDPLFTLRIQTALALRDRGWITWSGKNNGRYQLLRSPTS
jgi:hypothetical protein